MKNSAPDRRHPGVARPKRPDDPAAAVSIKGRSRRWAAALVAALSACDGSHRGPSPADLKEGEAIYRAECASCHGVRLQGQPNWRVRQPDGKLPAPPHDASGHTWHHPMQQLIDITKHGLVPPNAPEGYVSNMPAFGGKLNDRQIRNVLAYIESQWPPEIHAHRAGQVSQK